MRPSAPFRLIVHARRDGRLNMAVDEALLRSVAAGTSPPVLRLYGFSPATLSLGRFQSVRDRLRMELIERDGITLVRRPTGGQAVLHDEELTYSVVLGRAHLQPFGKREIYRFIAELLLEGLRILGVSGVVNRQRRGSPHNPDCFGTAGEYEIASGIGEKLIGSAQLVTRQASLQHGAIPLNDSYRRIHNYLVDAGGPGDGQHRPSSLGQELGREPGFEEAVEAFSAGFRRRLQVEPSELTEREWADARDLERSRYSDSAWNLRL